MPATIVALHLSTRNRAPLAGVARVQALASRGLEGDRHAKPNNRRAVLLMELEVLDHFGLTPGAVREQVTVRGLELMKLDLGSRLRVGEAVLEVGGPCAPCARMDEIRPGLKDELEGRRGRFVTVIQDGWFAVGDTITVEPGASRAEAS
ncbi:MAG TPA: MOSC domain-containing protein [Candidatus Limnocylindria bacterium]|nr:MOSC domain-containing protein [Candidatus Limnocylindria bacterium]